MTTSPSNQPPKASALQRFGPLVGIVAVILVVAGVVIVSGRDGKETASSSGPATAAAAAGDLPITYNQAKKDGKAASTTWVDNCDPATGLIKMPTVYAPPCVPAFSGDNGGATYPGVSKDKVTVAYYVTPPTGDIMSLLSGNLDPPDQVQETIARYTEMLNNVFETYGRKVDIVRFDATGQASDPVGAKADAQAVIDTIKPFASINGPALTNAYAEELTRQGVLCLACGLSVPDQTFQDQAPYLWGSQATPEEYLATINAYLTDRVAGRNAVYAGDDAMKTTKRVFGTVHFEQDPPVFSSIEDTAAKCGLDTAWKSVDTETYTLDIPKLAERATTIVARLKSSGVTTVVFIGDPLMPIYLTKAATAQNYFPEWFITGTVLTDTSALARSYDPLQWSHAFGLSQLAARVPREQSDPWSLHEWYFGTPPAAAKLYAILFPPLFQLFQGIHMAGKNLTPETFKQGMFNLPEAGGGPTVPHVSYGDHGYFKLLDPATCTADTPRPDYLGIDDMTEIWWDSTAVGQDEQGKDGTGLYRYANNGKRYLPNAMPTTDSDAFKTANTVTIFAEPPAEDVAPTYPSPKKS